jgi:hypothetical protein
MRKVILRFVKAAFPTVAGLSALMNSAIGQQNIIVDKDNTHPEIKESMMTPARVTSFDASRGNGYNDIHWTALYEQDTRRFIVEYSRDGINFQTAGEAIAVNGNYSLKHYIFGTEPLIYRIRVEKKDGRFFNTAPFLLEGSDIPPVKIYPTAIEGNIINVDAIFPVERINIFSTDGRQVFAQDMGGVTGYSRVTIPPLSKGMYLLTCFGKGWNSTSKIVVGR